MERQQVDLNMDKTPFKFLYLCRDLKFSFYDLLRNREVNIKTKLDMYNYIRTHKKHILLLPPDLQYTDENIEHLQENIELALQFLGKEPDDCLLPVNCKIFTSNTDYDVKLHPPLEALIAINDSGVRISLNIMIDFDDPHIWDGAYTNRLKYIFDILKRIECLKIDFNFSEQDEDEFSVLSAESSILYFNEIQLLVRKQDSQLKSLSICKMELNASQLISCLQEITELSSFSMSDVFLYNPDQDFLNIRDLGKEFCEALLLKPLSKLKLSNTLIDSSYPILNVLPYLRPEILLKLRTLNLSDRMSFCDLHHGDRPIFSMKLYKSLANLEKLNLADNGINKECMKILSPLIQSLNNLKELNLADNGIDGNCIDELIPTLQMFRSLSELCLSSNNLDYDAIKRVAKSLPMLKVLDVTDNNPSQEQTGMESIV